VGNRPGQEPRGSHQELTIGIDAARYYIHSIWPPAIHLIPGLSLPVTHGKLPCIIININIKQVDSREWIRGSS
jgi:hypothetical protein